MSKFGFTRSMTEEEIRRTYKKQVMKYHPDKISQRTGVVTDQDTKTFQDFQSDYEYYLDQFQKYGAMPSAQPRPSPFSTPPPRPSPSSATPPPPTPPPRPSPKTQTPPPRPTSTNTEKPKKCRCCSVCGKAGHTRTTCPFVNPVKAARRERSEARKQQRQEKTSSPPPSPPPSSKKSTTPEPREFTSQCTKISYTIDFAIPKGAVAGDVINVPYVTVNGKQIHKYRLPKHQVGFKSVSVRVYV